MSNTQEFKLSGTEYIELKNLLKVTGLCETGAQAKAAIDIGQVLVDGVKENRKALKVKPGQTVEFEGQIIKVLA